MNALYNAPARSLVLLLMNISAMFEIACANLPSVHDFCPALLPNVER